jgi:hypothetical protein
MPLMQYQLPNGKVINLSLDQFLDMTDEDIQYLISIEYGEYVRDPFNGSAVEDNKQEKYYDFDYLADDESEDNIISDDDPFDDIIDLSGSLDI